MGNPVPRKRAKPLAKGTTFALPGRPVLPPNADQHRLARARQKAAKLKWRALPIPAEEELLGEAEAPLPDPPKTAPEPRRRPQAPGAA